MFCDLQGCVKAVRNAAAVIITGMEGHNTGGSISFEKFEICIYTFTHFADVF